ncbi:hypothetical protein NDI37_19575 [Funiculus sociatus GB2-A5]|uniref:Uncharacterized protein n=2 Tax=Cyanophyceae TaxID=3028117 RepID=A0ABV0JT79_9CYAN|nr:hypothetical protein [Trichocoleus sp. FACHB-6]MBD1907585.1 hypothetical protein [Trichocoleus sp. FACHB-832]
MDTTSYMGKFSSKLAFGNLQVKPLLILIPSPQPGNEEEEALRPAANQGTSDKQLQERVPVTIYATRCPILVA